MTESKQAYVYIMTSARNGTLYIGVSSDLCSRVMQHKSGLISGFSSQYGTKTLVYYERHTDMSEAIAVEKRLKKWKRLWKIRLIEKINPEWRDLSLDWVD